MSTLKQQIKAAQSTLKSLIALQASEAAFKKAKPAEKRVMIARDVLAQLRAKKLIARSGIYVSPSPVNSFGECEPLADGVPQDFREFMVAPVSPGAQCTACALGGIFACAVKFKNDVRTREAAEVYSDDVEIKRYLDQVFSEAQLELIECAFERSNSHAERQYDPDDEEIVTAVRFGKCFSTDEQRMTAIMKNIIANKGTFKP